MRLKVRTENRHESIVTAVAFTRTQKQYELYSCSDDKKIWKWSLDGTPLEQVCELDVYCNGLHWVGQGNSDTFAVCCSDGTFRLISKSGREEKKVEAHRGAVICLRLSYDGTAIATAGEDSTVKVWSRSGMLRSTIAQMSHPVYCVAWSPDCEHLLFACERKLHLKSIQAGQRSSEWKAHEGIVLQVDWSPVNNLIISGAEDCKYKVWDAYGRLMFTSAPMDHVVTAVAWAPSGKFFAVGSFNVLKLCDRTGWSYHREQLERSGSVFGISWFHDGTSFAVAGGNGSVSFATIIDRSVSYHNLDATVDENNTVTVRSMEDDTMEELDHRDRVIDMALGPSGHLVVTTSSQCFVYSSSGWANPHVEDLKEPPTLIIQCPYHFALVDSAGVNVYSYEGRQLSTVRYAGLRVELLNQLTLAICRDTIALVDPVNPRTVRLFDALSGRPVGTALEHRLEVIAVGLNQHGMGADRKLAILDRNRDLYVTPVHKPDFQKLGSMIDAFIWSDSTDMLVGLGDQKLMTWLYPATVFIDKDLLPLTVLTQNAQDAGKNAEIASFTGTHVTLRRADGSKCAQCIPPYPLLLYQLHDKGHWDKAIRLCRYVKMPEMWACVAAMSMHVRELPTVEIALAAIDQVDKVHFIGHINKLPDETLKSAELAVLCRKPDEAVQILLSNRRIYRAIKLNIRLHRWEDALNLAMQNKTHVDTVLAYREQHLKELDHEENNVEFKKIAATIGPVDWTAIKAKVEMEKEEERREAGLA
jgi:intraflagellar transport protein 80